MPAHSWWLCFVSPRLAFDLDVFEAMVPTGDEHGNLKQVLETVPAIKKYSGSGPDAFPNKPGAARELTNPALEFIKSLCHVLSLDPTVADEVRTNAGRGKERLWNAEDGELVLA